MATSTSARSSPPECCRDLIPSQVPPLIRDIIFLVADGSMEQMLSGFLCRPSFHRSLKCGPFIFDPARDLIVATRRDPEVYGLADELLRPFQATHTRAVVLLDNAWEGSPGATQIHDRLCRRLRGSWDQFAVIVLEPELGAWIWQDSNHIATALGCPIDFRQILAESGHWPFDQTKPTDPKKALDHLRDRYRADRSKAVFRRLASRISVKGCTDPVFQQLRDTLREWFPEETL